MAENEGMEGKNLAKAKKKEFKENVLEQVKKLKSGESKTIIGEMEATKIGDQVILKVRGKSIAIVTGKDIEYNLPNFEELKKQLEEDGQTLDDLGLPDLQTEIDKIQKQTSKQEEKDDEQPKTEDDEQGEQEQGDDEPDLEDESGDLQKEEVAREYNVKSNQVIHISKDEKVTADERFQGLAIWAQEYDNIYVIPGQDYYSYKFIGEKDGQREEIEAANNLVDGKHPNITVKRIDGEAITEVRPIAMYEIDTENSVAIVRNEHGEPEALYCRQEAGNEKEYWGSIIPEASGKNVLQQDARTREFITPRYQSHNDLDDKANALSTQNDLEERGLPSREKGVQVNEIDKNPKQNISLNIEEVAKDLMKRDGVKDSTTVQPGLYEHKAKKVLDLMRIDKNITYEQAVEQIEKQGQREEGGRARGEKFNPRTGE